MFDYSKIDDVICQYSKCPIELKEDCVNKDISDNTIVHAIKVGNKFLNSHAYNENETYKYSYRDICNTLNPKNIYDFTFCLALYNSQSINQTAINKIFKNENNYPPTDYEYLLKDTSGWVFWDYQFMNILRLYTIEKDIPNIVYNDYKRNRVDAIKNSNDWLIGDKKIIESMEENMLQKYSIFRFILKIGKQIYYGLQE